MSNDKHLRIVMQAIGVYCVVQSLFTLFQATVHWIVWRYVEHHTVRDSMFTILIQSLVIAALMLVPAFVLLTKTDWCVRIVAGMSKSKGDAESANSL